tara:strand:+ start:38 stop:754 length:717 start_codon:yes stop_codon:yes gene_type:complete
MNSEILEKELATFLDEQSSYLAPIPIEKLQGYIKELEKNNSVAQDQTTNDTPTDHVVNTQSPTDHVVSKKGNTNPVTEKIDLLIVVTKQDAYHIAKSSETEDSEASLLIKNLLKAACLDHKKRHMYALDVPDERIKSTAVNSDTLSNEELPSKITASLLDAIRQVRPSFILVFDETAAPILNSSTFQDESMQGTAKMGELFEIERINCLITHSIGALLQNKSLKRETWEHVQKIPSNF